MAGAGRGGGGGWGESREDAGGRWRGMLDTDGTRVRQRSEWLRTEGTRIGGGEVREGEAKGFRRIATATEGTENRAGLGPGEADRKVKWPRDQAGRGGAVGDGEGQWVMWLLGMCGQRVNRAW